MKVILGIKRLGTSFEGGSCSTLDSLPDAIAVSGKSCLIGSGIWGP